MCEVVSHGDRPSDGRHHACERRGHDGRGGGRVIGHAAARVLPQLDGHAQEPAHGRGGARHREAGPLGASTPPGHPRGRAPRAPARASRRWARSVGRSRRGSGSGGTRARPGRTGPSRVAPRPPASRDASTRSKATWSVGEAGPRFTGTRPLVAMASPVAGAWAAAGIPATTMTAASRPTSVAATRRTGRRVVRSRLTGSPRLPAR